MYLAYLDDSETGQRQDHSFQVLSAVVIKDEIFSNIEILAAASVEMCIPQDKLEGFMTQFEEFHAHELFGGRGAFEGIDQATRFEMIHHLLDLIVEQDLTVIYGAVNKQLLAKHDYGSAKSIDICFRICARAVEKWLADKASGELGFLIVDDFDKPEKTELTKSFRQLRQPIRLEHIHDDMYFGDSRYSIGIQLADLCSFFIAKHLQGQQLLAEPFYNIIAKRIVYSKVEPPC